MTDGYQPIADDKRKVKPPPSIPKYQEVTADNIHAEIESMRWEIERQKTHTREGWDRADELRQIADRLLVLATKWCDLQHHDWTEIKHLAERLGHDA